MQKKWVKIAAAALGAAALFVGAGALWVLKTYPQAVYSSGLSCVWYQLTGYYCAGCGITRGLHELLNGHWYAAFRMNPFMFVVIPAACVLAVWEISRILRHRPSIPLKPWMVWTFLALMILFTVLRNLPWEPFCQLAPTQVLQGACIRMSMGI
ncbi:MAG: DUF2752 domain-containing protein [Eubacteriales bacterium]|nr:DUF2752 domain-containing protein [Eubacteriales bacterium]